MSQTPQVQYLTNDHLGTPRINTNENGAVVSRTDYMPYGEEIIGLGGRSTTDKYVTDDFRQGFTGYLNDEETNLDYAQARMYKKELGRFTSTDPIFLELKRSIDPQRVNLYSYSRNNPFSFVDKDGNDVEVSGDAADEFLSYLQGAVKSRKMKLKLVNGKIEIDGLDRKNKKGLDKFRSKLNDSDQKLFDAIFDVTKTASIQADKSNDSVTFAKFGGNRGKQIVDMGEMKLLDSPANKGGQSTSQAVAHEVYEAYLAQGNADEATAHTAAALTFGGSFGPIRDGNGNNFFLDPATDGQYKSAHFFNTVWSPGGRPAGVERITVAITPIPEASLTPLQIAR